MSYPRVPIGDLVSLRQGFAINKNTKHHISDESTALPLLRIADMKDKVQNVFVKDTIPAHFIAKPEDIIYTRTGQVGLVFTDQYGVIHNNCFTVTPNDAKTLNRYYLYYVLQSEDFYSAANNLASGAAQPDLPHGAFRSIEIPVPPLASQMRIAEILKGYDDLIENNQKQIKLLEEAAQRLYKEWFIDLRFPGHETTPIVDGVPEGWNRGILGDIVTETGEKVSKEKRDIFDYYLPIDCLPKKSLGYVTTNEIKLAESSLVSFAPGDILFGAMRPYFHKVVVARDSGLTRTTCFVLNTPKKVFWAYAVMLMFSPDTVDYASQISVGTTMPYTRWKDFKNMPILIPEESCACKFGEIVCPIIEKINGSAKQVMLLQRARDRLLPKLMSGEIEV